ncbi:LysR family transcriptional regulator [Niallia sp. 01092]|uniref:LysR family transcriptional regulator n=1 Tax=unclassified Niallia TaxID=2837522 RepID=UPI003FD1C762
MVDFEWYRSFISIYKHNSVSEAAKERIMTQPAMSQHLAALEAEVGQPLFTRTSRKMLPTERGKELYSEVAPLIEALEEKTIGLKSVSLSSVPVIRFGSAIEFFNELILPNLNDEKFRMIAHFGVASQLMDQLSEDKVDLIVTSKKFHMPGIEYIPLMKEEFVLVAPKELMVPDFQDLNEVENWLVNQKWLSYGLDLPIIRRFWRQHFSKRPQLKPIHVIPNLHALLASVEYGTGITLIPTFLLDHSMNGEKAKKIMEHLKVPNELYIAYKTKHKNSPEMNQAIDFIKRISNKDV